MEECGNYGGLPGRPSEIHSLRLAEKRIRALLSSDAALGLCALILLDLDQLPDDDGAYQQLMQKIEGLLLRIFSDRAVLGRSENSVLILVPNIHSRSLVKLQLEQLCSLLEYPYDEGTARRSSCTAGMALWQQMQTSPGYDSVREAATAALSEQRKRLSSGYTIIEADETGAFHKSGSELMPSQLLDKRGVGVMLLQTGSAFICLYHNESARRLLQFSGCRGHMQADALFSCLRERDRSSLEAMIDNSMASFQLKEITCRKTDGKWLTIRLLPVSGQQGAEDLLYITLFEPAGIAENDLENRLAHTKKEILSEVKHMPTFEIDVATGTLTLSREIRRLFDCREECMDGIVTNVPQVCKECCSCIARESMGAYLKMFAELYDGKTEGTAVIKARSRLTGKYIPVKNTWKGIFNDSGKLVKAIGIAEPLVPETPAASGDTIAKLRAKLALQETYFLRSDEYLRALRKFRHDQKNYIIALTAFLNTGKIQEALDFLGKMDTELRINTPLVTTGNPSVDAIISDKLKLAMDRGVKVTRIVGLSPDLTVDTMDLCLAVGSCLDNALEAAEKVAAAGSEPWIDFSLIEQKNVIVLKMANSCLAPDAQIQRDKTSKSDKLNHGFGLQSVRDIVEKYGGTLALNYGENAYTTAFTLFL